MITPYTQHILPEAFMTKQSDVEAMAAAIALTMGNLRTKHAAQAAYAILEPKLLAAREALEGAAHELNAIRARDGAPQHICWDRGRALQTSSCDEKYFSSIVDKCHEALEILGDDK